MDGARATVVFCDETYELGASSSGLTIGRAGDVVLDDDNLSLHRRFLVLYRSGGRWWLRNTGSILTAEVVDGDHRVKTALRPGGCIALTGPVTVRATAGRTTYELSIGLHGSSAAPPDPGPGRDAGPDGAGTVTVGRVELTDLQRLVVLALAEPVLRDPRPGPVRPATASEVTARLGWSARRFHKHLDATCRKLAQAGVPGMRDANGGRAGERRARLVEYAIATGLVAGPELARLDGHWPGQSGTGDG